LICLSVTGKYDEWIGAYPEELKSTLVELNGLVDTAESKVNKISSKIWRPKHLLLAELDAIRSQLGKIPHEENGKSTQRANMEKRALNGPDWLYSDDMVAKLLPIVDLNKGPRNLAIRIIKNRGDNPPWDFRYEAKNIQFREKMEAKGINVEKWIEGIGPRTYQANESIQVHIDISKDPLDTINMGGHFKTCLSPGNFNFFSVFANIADLNKQVLYGKNDAGKVIGRVLVGMTDSK